MGTVPHSTEGIYGLRQMRKMKAIQVYALADEAHQSTPGISTQADEADQSDPGICTGR